MKATLLVIFLVFSFFIAPVAYTAPPEPGVYGPQLPSNQRFYAGQIFVSQNRTTLD